MSEKRCDLCGDPMEGHGYWNACQTPERIVARQAATIARLEAENAKLVDLLRVDIITQERDALEAENAQMRSLISSRPDAPQAFWDEHRVALESARQRAGRGAVITYGGQQTKP